METSLEPKYYLVRFVSVCCAEITQGVFPLTVVKGEFDYFDVSQFLTRTHGHLCMVIDWKIVDAKVALQAGKWFLKVNQELANSHLQNGMPVAPGEGPFKDPPKPQRPKPETKTVDNVTYVKEWFKIKGMTNETDPSDPGPSGVG